MAEWIRFRLAFGLRADTPWVLAVAANPAATVELGLPLLPTELDDVVRQNQLSQDLVPELERYGEAFPGEYAGSLVDGSRSVIQFTVDLERHQLALKAIFGAAAPIEVRRVPYSLGDLDGFVQSVLVDADWFRTVSADLSSVSPDVLTDGVRIAYRAKDQSVEGLIRQRLGDPPWLRFEWDGPRHWTGQHGSLRVRVLDHHSQPVRADCLPTPVDVSVEAAVLPRATDDAGVCEFTGVPATEYTVRVSVDSGDSLNTYDALVGVAPDGVGTTTVVVE